MSELELVTLIVSLIVGLSMARMLSSTAVAIRMRQEIQLHWVPFCWGGAILLLHVQFLLAVYDIDVIAASWTWDWLGPVLLLSVLLFLSGALVLPTRDRELSHGLQRDFETHGRLALIPLSLYLLLWIPLNVRFGQGWISLANALDALLVVLAAFAFFGRTPRIRAPATLIYLVVVIWSVFAVWSPGGLHWVGN